MMKSYRVIYADPPWQFSSKQLQKYGGDRFASLESREYPTMTVPEIMSMPVSEVADDDCALFLWVTDAHLPEALNVIDAWGFKYITVAFIWSKKTSTGKQVATLGAWTMKNCELCLFATRGQMLKYKVSNNVYQLIESERTGHSVKPDDARQRILSMFGDVRRVELFARQKVEGWDCVGNEVTGEDIRVSLLRMVADV